MQGAPLAGSSPRLLFQWAAGYDRRSLRPDVLAGLAVAGLVVPEAIAYAGIAGVPPAAGLASAAAGLLIFGVFGSSRHLAVSPTSASAVTLAATVAPLAAGSADRYVALASATAALVGLLFLVGGRLRLGFLSDFIARSVLKGFTFGLAITIISRQLPKLLGTPAASGDFLQRIAAAFVGGSGPHLPTVLLSVLAIFFIFAIAPRLGRVPPALSCLVVGLAAGAWLPAEQFGIETVGAHVAGVARPGLPAVGWNDLMALLPQAFGVSLLLLVESMGSARTYASRVGYEVDPNREMAALAAANLGSALSRGIVVGGGLSATAANHAAGARTQLAAIVAGAFSVLSLFVFLPYFRHLPEAILGAIVVHAVWHLLDVRTLREMSRIRRRSITDAMVALVGVLAFGILPGLLIAVTFSLVLLMQRISFPRFSILGRLPGTHTFVSVADHASAEPVPGMLIVRPDGMVFFANANRMRFAVLDYVRQATPKPECVIIDNEMVPELDMTSAEALSLLFENLEADGIVLRVARVREPVWDMLKRTGLVDRIGRHNLFWTMADAVAAPLHPGPADGPTPEELVASTQG